MARYVQKHFALLLLSMAAFCLIGCTNCDVKGQTPIIYNGGVTEGDFYESSAWSGEWLHFPSGRVFRFPHGLDSDHLTVSTYLAYNRIPFPDDMEGSAAESAGNPVIIEEVTQDYVQVRNDTCADPYLRVSITKP